MSCPLGDHGQALCNIVNHPDRLSESFCGTCERRFVKREFGFEFGGFLVAVAALLFLTLFNRSNPTYSGAAYDGANDLPASNVAQTIPDPGLASDVEQPYTNPEEPLPERVVDWPMEKQLELLNGGSDRIALSP